MLMTHITLSLVFSLVKDFDKKKRILYIGILIALFAGQALHNCKNKENYLKMFNVQHDFSKLEFKRNARHLAAT